MPKKRYTPEQIVAQLRQVDVALAQGQSIAQAVKAIGVTETTFDELLDRELFYSLREAQVLIESWRVHDNAVRPHSALGYRAPAPEVLIGPASPALGSARPALTPRLVQTNVLH